MTKHTQKKTIIIAGAGFGGLTALDRLHKSRGAWQKEYDLILIDKKNTFDFLPLTPDVLAGWLHPRHTQIDLQTYCQKRKCRFIKGYIQDVDFDKHVLKTKSENYAFDYAILSCGGHPNFFGNTKVKSHSYVLNSTKNALDIQEALIRKSQGIQTVKIVVVGGGYTGLEAATNSLYFMRHRKRRCNVCIVEKAPALLSMVDPYSREIAIKELNHHGIAQRTENTVIDYDQHTVRLQSGEELDNAVCIWSAGVRCPSFFNEKKVKQAKSRVVVDAHLNLAGIQDQQIFAIGDNAAFFEPGSEAPLRMAVMFAMGQGKVAARNIVNHIRSRPVTSYTAKDLGYVIPLTYRKAPGVVLGRTVGPHIGYWLHYLMSMYRSKPEKWFGILKDLLITRNFKNAH
jgi:NADH dehydrogenase